MASTSALKSGEAIYQGKTPPINELALATDKRMDIPLKLLKLAGISLDPQPLTAISGKLSPTARVTLLAPNPADKVSPSPSSQMDRQHQTTFPGIGLHDYSIRALASNRFSPVTQDPLNSATFRHQRPLISTRLPWVGGRVPGFRECTSTRAKSRHACIPIQALVSLHLSQHGIPQVGVDARLISAGFVAPQFQDHIRVNQITHSAISPADWVALVNDTVTNVQRRARARGY